jgi:hypothetical protein
MCVPGLSFCITSLTRYQDPDNARLRKKAGGVKFTEDDETRVNSYLERITGDRDRFKKLAREEQERQAAVSSVSLSVIKLIIV